MSDHDLVKFCINANPRRVCKPPHKVYLFNRMDLPGLKKRMAEVATNFKSTNPESISTEENWSFFKEEIINEINIYVPSRMTKRKSGLPWMRVTIKRQLRKLERLLQRPKRSGSKTSTAWETCKKQRNKVTKAFRDAHKNYVNNVVGGSLQSNLTKFWHYVKHSRSESLGIPSLRKDNNIYISAKDKAEILSQHFQSVFTQDNGSLPDLGTPLCPGIDNIIFTEPGIRKQLDSLSTCKAASPDGIPSRILHDLSAEIAETLCFLFQQSYDTGQLPNDWLVAMIVPVYKKDQRSNLANYRPICLTSLVCKVMEHCVLSQIHKHLNANNIITPLQHGFRAGFSCETQLIMAVHDWATTLNNHGQVDAIMLDFRKAFDKVSHAKLIHKLEHYGIQGKTRLWLAAFLTKRSQFVAVDGSHSSHLEVVSALHKRHC